MSTRITYGTYNPSGNKSAKKVRFSASAISELFEITMTGIDPSTYIWGQEQEYLNRICFAPMKFAMTFQKKHLKPQYRVLIDIVAKCLLSMNGSLEQVSKMKLRLMAAIEA